ncbi:LppX_LprAFG lipoprotein [Amycolatopsis benzoatilytica]|uniref:LppX_LprAFG lipoprotein n=1 Tax=Amycolatopsis benzoatilytica TaxID=346045 RepID=UPI0003778C35|nr:LppX_LprAFG lipoprotein [Amycolatopsis benzoatilytica]
MLSRRALPVLLLFGLAAGCSAAPPLPAAGELLAAAKTNFAAVRSLRFTVGVNGVLPGLPMTKLSGDMTLQGKGAVSGRAEFVDRAFTFAVSGSTATTKDAKGHETTGSTAFTASRYLGPGGSLVELLGALRQPQTEIREVIQQIDGYRVGGTLPRAVAAKLIPQIHSDVNVKVWVTVAEPRRFARMWLQVPPASERDSPVMYEVLLTDQQP